jgi:asparagine synthase (glutamine-hydrolysing)
MCGIVGVIGRDRRDRPQDGLVRPRSLGAGALAPMLAAVAARGPDDEATLVAGQAALGHRRLSILDLTPAGRQPMTTPDGRHALVMNGEVYNHAELRRSAEARGARFRGRCDAEAVLHHLAHAGESGLRDLRGMFALAFVDLETGEVLLARDRMGVKPLYFAEKAGAFAFASEAKALLAGGFADAALDLAAADQLLSHFVVPAPWCAFRGVRALRPGEVVRRRADGRVESAFFAELSFGGPPVEADDAVRRVRRAVEDAVRSHLMSDVPVGVFLSGGVDSGAVALLAARASRAPLHAFTLTYGRGHAPYDESAAAAAVARHGGLVHHVRAVTGADVHAALAKIVFALDEPGASGLPNYFVSELAREHGVKACLSGLGGDELFAGYSRYLHLARRERAFSRWSAAPRSLRGAVASAARTLSPGGRIARFLDSADQSFGERSWRYKLVLDEDAKRALWAASVDVGKFPSTRDHMLGLFAAVADLRFVDQIAYVDAKTYLANDLLRHEDAMSMAHGVESRVPLLDGPLVDLAFSLPPEMRLRGDVRKHVFREAVRDLFPAGHLDRPKAGFCMPADAWLRDGPLRPVLDATLAERVVRKRGLFRPEAVARIVAEFLASPPGSDEAGTAESRVWTLVMLELWQRMFVDDGAPRSADVTTDELVRGR